MAHAQLPFRFGFWIEFLARTRPVQKSDVWGEAVAHGPLPFRLVVWSYFLVSTNLIPVSGIWIAVVALHHWRAPKTVVHIDVMFVYKFRFSKIW